VKALLIVAGLVLSSVRADEADPKKTIGAIGGLKGFASTPKCPVGTHAVASRGLQPYRCERDAPYLSYTLVGEMSFEYPRDFQPLDGWKEDVPTVSFTLNSKAAGKPVTITITKIERAQAAYIDLEAALAKDKDWQDAKDGGTVTIAGIASRTTFVVGESKTAYVPFSKDDYYTIVYSAPAEAYAAHIGAFEHLLKTLRLTGRSS
jgi:hypothetical protein